MKRIDYAICAVIILIGILSKIPFIEQYQSHWDGPQYTIALANYSFAQQTPAPPGYPLYIGIGKFFHLFIQDPHKAITATSLFGGIAGAIVVFFVGLKMYHRLVGVTASAIFLTGSTFYYFSISPHTYNLLAATTTLLAYAVYRIFIKNKQEGVILGVIIGICFSLRPQEIMQIGILFLLGFLSLSHKEKMKAFVVFVITTLSWFIPVTRAVGFIEYFTLSNALLKTALFNQSIMQHAEMMLKGFLLSFGISGGFLVYYAIKVKKIKKLITKHRKILIFYSAWIFPSFLYNLLLRSDVPGYQFSYLTAILFLISYAIWQITRKKMILYVLAVTCISIFNLYWFFFDRDPTFTKPHRMVSFHQSELRKNDIKVGSKITYIRTNFNPKTTLIIASTDYWRIYMYHLRNYQIFSPSGLTTKEKQYIYKEYFGFDWNMKEKRNKQLSLNIPTDITTVVLTDDDGKSWVKQYPIKVTSLPGNSSITTFRVTPKKTLRYNFHSIIIE